jgi:ElaB/YqjD/DUF883 family membrane-anchored ribosome-binding protein
MSDQIEETVSRARKMGEKANKYVHDEYDSMNKEMHKKQKMIDSLIHEEPYMAIGVGLLAGFGLGVILCSLTRHRD